MENYEDKIDRLSRENSTNFTRLFINKGCKYPNCSCTIGTGCRVVKERERERDKSNDK